MSKYHVVQQGEHVSRIAAAYGFTDFRTVWDHPQNAELKKVRQNPNVLYPGERIFIPDREDKEEAAVTDTRHRFEVNLERLSLKLILEEHYRGPIAGAECGLIVEGGSVELTSDDRGFLEHPIPADAETAALIIRMPEAVSTDVLQLPIKIGHLDPVEYESGQRARLNNLGYFAGAPGETDQAMLRSAIEEFQCDHPPLKVDGICGKQTQKKLVDVHGC